jgi:hypothetical protein
MFTTLFAFLSASLAIIWSSVFLLVSIFGLRLQKVSGNKLRAFNSKVTVASVWTDENEPDQWILGKWFIGYIYATPSGQHGGEQKVLYLFSSHYWYEQTVNGLKEDKLQKSRDITVFDRIGPFWHYKWESFQVSPPNWEPYPSQEQVIHKIMDEFKTRGSATCLLCGPPGSGKSNVPLLLARYMLTSLEQIAFTDTFNPTDPNDTFSAMYTRISPDQKKPLIVVLEEVDGMVLAMHQNTIKRHEHLPIQVTCKSDWNKWLDRFDRGYYKNVILMMTSNRSLNWFDELDPSYFREGRVNIKMHIPKISKVE